MWKFKESHLYS
ncbi:hypothetical protein RDI58_025226 [Solanum bulbocastanum]|uniref:Uncharacterized protein n=1 Tax=Solanum bulbocastanum TaxID=147425 RepID=A0AAN8T6B0_SOLBU